MDKNTFQELVNRYLDGSATTAEKALVDRYCEHLETSGDTGLEPEQEAYLQSAMYARILKGIQTPRKRNFRWAYAAAASVLVLVTVGAFFYTRHSTPPARMAQASVYHNDLQPGSNKATLTLANGTTIVLDEKTTDTLALQGNSRIAKPGGGQLVYEAAAGTQPVVYNTLSTPAGGQFRLILSDGSKVWLNASSTITFPTAFTGKDRSVELKGEAFLEINKDAQKPFKVKVRDMEVTVLGTQFNINAYNDETSISTTLLEGAVSVNRGERVCMLKPGQQAQLLTNGEFSLLNNVDTDGITAWKNGEFSFNDADITTVMRQVARWYGAEVIYEGKINHHFMGTIPRDVPVSRLLKMLELTGRVSFTVDGNKIFVRP
ncbi:FecR family protein [Chitinophaga flava]|uniref:Iron dicitrate transport regulator FecR n=1 Tax=Chitinophaga flava TaxID=2259036 RepID=A0A365Y3F7_9BACT|nr:FecR family protein [Chitinophaga flava]RBL93059.1 hypothetical protein DF182_10950 [Chitinophaga flava]